MLTRQNFLTAPQWMSNEMERMVRNVFGDRTAASRNGASATVPPLNLWETDTAFTVELNVPGMTMADLEVLLNGSELTIKGNRKATELPQDARMLRSERPVGEFERTIGFETPVDQDKVQASLINGVLTVVLPKAESARPKRIEIKG